MLPFVLALAAIGPRLLGGASALRGRERLHLAMGFAGGALIGVALLDTGPEAVDLLPGGLPVALAIALVGLVAFAALERTVFGHVHQEDAACHPVAGHIGAAGISVHAFLDGLAIGTAFQVSTQVGAAVSIAVLLHAFSDGMNTVTTALRHGVQRAGAVALAGRERARAARRRGAGRPDRAARRGRGRAAGLLRRHVRLPRRGLAAARGPSHRARPRDRLAGRRAPGARSP